MIWNTSTQSASHFHINVWGKDNGAIVYIPLITKNTVDRHLTRTKPQTLLTQSAERFT